MLLKWFLNTHQHNLVGNLLRKKILMKLVLPLIQLIMSVLKPKVQACLSF